MSKCILSSKRLVKLVICFDKKQEYFYNTIFLIEHPVRSFGFQVGLQFAVIYFLCLKPSLH